MNAYDIELLKTSVSDGEAHGHGWCFGLPPGIRPEQWPLDPNNGYPLSHGFTILLPEDYRVHGPEFVALSFFATAHNDGGPETVEEIATLFQSFPNGGEPIDPDLRIFWDAESNRHPQLHRMVDILGCAYAVILLTQHEFDGPFCMPPAVEKNPYRDQVAPPDWLTIGAAASFWGGEEWGNLAVEEIFYFKVFGQAPEKSVKYNRALEWRPRATDPNAGIAPREDYAADATGYQSYYYFLNDEIETENYREHEWAKGHQSNHIGGTMRPAQGIPDISPFYIEFEEYLGGYNFGGGNAWLDFKEMRFDWACG